MKPLPEVLPGTHAPPLPLDALAAHDDVEPIDVETARLMRRLSANGTGSHAAAHAALLLSAQRRAGAACVRLKDWAGRPFPEDEGPPLPALADWRAQLAASPLVGEGRALAEEGAAPTPLVLAGGADDDGRLYLYRYWRAEQDVARLLHKRLEADAEPLPEGAHEAFGCFFETKGEAASGQAVAAACALFSPLTVLTGGPGTGKTYAAARLLALLLTARPGLRVALAAPTGKAAKRLGASIASEVETLDLPDAVRQSLHPGGISSSGFGASHEAQTLHRLLGYRPHANRFRHDAGHPLDVDAVLVDESSMIDLLLFQALLEALPEHARLIFLGDAHQLASIGAGRVLADLTALRGTGRSPAFARHVRRLGAGTVPIADDGPPLRDAVVTLKKTYRFGSDSGIAALAAAVRDGESDRAVEVLHSDDYPEVRLVPHPERHGAGASSGDVLGATLAHARALCGAETAEAALARKDEAQVLAATYYGPWGVHAVNGFVEGALRRGGNRPAGRPPGALPPSSGRFYPGRLVLVTENDYEQDLFNGDLGVCVAHQGQLQAYFDEGGGGPRAVPLARLPRHESAWAVTVHKSQGSEYGAVTLLLPQEMKPPLCRELVYTAITRAKERVTVVGPEAVLRAAVAAPERRASGLGEALMQERSEQGALP